MCPITETEVAAARRRVLFSRCSWKTCHTARPSRAGPCTASQLKTTKGVRDRGNHTLTCKYYYILGLMMQVIQESYIPLQSGDHGDHFKLLVFKTAS